MTGPRMKPPPNAAPAMPKRWPRRWYSHAVERPQVEVATGAGDEAQPYLAVPLAGDELDRVAEIYDAGLVFKFLTGFPRLDPQ